MRMNTSDCSLLPNFSTTITVLNRLKSSAPNKFDRWFKTVLYGNLFTTKTTRTVDGRAVSVGSSYIVQVPQCADYSPYSQWKLDPAQGFTFSVGDIVFNGEIEETEITADNVNQILQKYRPGAFTVKVFKDNTAIKLAAHHYIEGV